MQRILSTGKCGLWQWQARIEGQIGKFFPDTAREKVYKWANRLTNSRMVTSP